MINLISAIYDHAVEQMETIDETIQEYNDKIAALQRERDTLNQLYTVAVGYRKSLGSTSISGVVVGDTINNVPRPTNVRNPYVGEFGKSDTTKQSQGIVPTVETTSVTQNQIVQPASQTYTIF